MNESTTILHIILFTSTLTNHNCTNTNTIPKSHCATVHKGRYNMPGEAVMKISNLKRHYEMKRRNYEEIFPNSEISTTQLNALKSSHQAASRILVTSMTQWNEIMHDRIDGHNVWRQTERWNIQLCILIYIKMEITFYFSLYFVVFNEKDILFWILQYYCMWPDQPQNMDLWVIEKNLCGPLRFVFEYRWHRLSE